MSVGATLSARSTTNFANCLTLMMYFASSESALMIFVQRATCAKQKEAPMADKYWQKEAIWRCVCMNKRRQKKAWWGQPVHMKFTHHNMHQYAHTHMQTRTKLDITCSGCWEWRACLSASKSHSAGWARPVSDSFTPAKNKNDIVAWLAWQAPLYGHLLGQWEKMCMYYQEVLLVPNTILEIEKEMARKVARGDKHYPRNSADHKAQNSKAFIPLTGLICALWSADFFTSSSFIYSLSFVF